jgi:hypothetical protein
VSEEFAIVERLFIRASMKLGSVQRLATQIGCGYADALRYMDGMAIPPDDGLLRAVEVVIDELPELRAAFSKEAWRALSLPEPPRTRR